MTRYLSAIALSAMIVLSACSGSEPGNEAPPEAGSDATALTRETVQGDWSGQLSVPGGPELWLVLHIGEDESGDLTVSMDSPDQGAMGIPGEGASVADGVFAASFPLIGAQFTMQSGKGDAMQGVWVQGMPIPVSLERGNNVPARVRPQEPETRDYVVEEVKFPGGADDVTLAGELTLPEGEGPFPGLVLISGSGPQDRNEELMNHKPFLVLSDHLTRNGYAVLRYDDRGFAESTGDFAAATSKDFADDAAAALAFLKADGRIDATRTAYVGHSEGGLVAPMAVEIEGAAAMVLLAGPGVPVSDVLTLQTGDMLRAEGGSDADVEEAVAATQSAFDIIRAGAEDDEALKAALQASLEEAGATGELAEATAARMTAPWMRWVMDYDPVPALKAFDGPVLAVFGEKDMQVSAKVNAPIMEASLTHPRSRVMTLEGLNHLFQPAETGGTSEYIKIETTFDEAALDEISGWLDDVLEAG